MGAKTLCRKIQENAGNFADPLAIAPPALPPPLAHPFKGTARAKPPEDPIYSRGQSPRRTPFYPSGALPPSPPPFILARTPRGIVFVMSFASF